MIIDIMVLENRFVFYDHAIPYKTFFDNNENLYRHYYDGEGYTFKLFDNTGNTQSPTLKIMLGNNKAKHIIVSTEDNINRSLDQMKITKIEIYLNDVLTEIGDISKRKLGGRKANPVKKEICGRLRCIYKISGSRKEYVKHKGSLITVADYKKLMKNKT